MQTHIPQILWHDNKNKIMSIDFYPNSTKHFVTSSFVSDDDSGIRFWEIKDGKGSQVDPTYCYDLSGGHQKTVNCVRWAPNGQFLASGSDDQLVVIWQLKSVPVEFGKIEEKFQWGYSRTLRGHVGDVMDLAWSNDSNYLVSASLDGSAILWQIGNGKFCKVQNFEGHKKFVQGVAIHPNLKMIATASSDATVRIYKNRKLKNREEFYNHHVIKQRSIETEKMDENLPMTENSNKDVQIEDKENKQENNSQIVEQGHNQPNKESNIETEIIQKEQTRKVSHRLFLDDTEYQSFIRRLAWSPDGSMLLTPGSWYQELNRMSTSGQDKNSFQYTVYGFLKNSINKPSFMLPGMTTHANCIRFCPYLLKLKEKKETDPPALIELPYQMIFAIGTVDNVLIYTTQSTFPIAIIKNLHYDTINDLAWCSNYLLAIASSDGFVSFVSFQQGQLGELLDLESEVIPQFLKEFYQNLVQVDIYKNIHKVQNEGNLKFNKVSFKSKKVAQPQADIVQNVAAERKTTENKVELNESNDIENKYVNALQQSDVEMTGQDQQC